MSLGAAASAEVAEYEYQLEQILAALEADPDNSELVTLKNELQDLIKLTKSQADPVVPSGVSVHLSKTTPNDTDNKKRKYESFETRKVGDQVLAKWITGDHQFYAARITSVTGNQADPVYTVKFVDYNEVQTLHGHQIRNTNEYKKRPAEAVAKIKASNLPSGSTYKKEVQQPQPPPPPSTTPSITKSKPKKSLKENPSKSASDWASFAKSGPKTKNTVGKRKPIGESSMFRTEENGRVGVIGSGRAMTSDPGKRGRHVFGTDRGH